MQNILLKATSIIVSKSISKQFDDAMFDVYNGKVVCVNGQATKTLKLKQKNTKLNAQSSQNGVNAYRIKPFLEAIFEKAYIPPWPVYSRPVFHGSAS